MTDRFWLYKGRYIGRGDNVDPQLWEEQIGRERLLTFVGPGGKVWSEMTCYVLEQCACGDLMLVEIA